MQVPEWAPKQTSRHGTTAEGPKQKLKGGFTPLDVLKLYLPSNLLQYVCDSTNEYRHV